MKQFKIALAALLAFALVPLFPSNALARNSQNGAVSAKSPSATALALAICDAGAAAPSASIHASGPASTAALERPAATKPNSGKSFAKTTDGIELLHGTFAFTTGVALIVASVALENNRRH